MAKSQETYNKKERENKKLKKKKDKEQKKEDRKTNSTRGFDDMIAYVDEFGNLTETPPDPKNKKVVNVDDIQIGIAKKTDEDEVPTTKTGIVSFFNAAKGYGFIRDDNSRESIFVHINGLIDSIKEGDKVSYETEMGKKGLNAVQVKLVK